METKAINLTYDRLFKFVFLHENLAEDLLNAYFDLFNLPHHAVIRDIPQALIPSKKKNKDYYSDVVLTLDNKEKVILEMYNRFNDEEYCKSLSYTSRLYGCQLNRKDKNSSFKDTKKVLCLNFIFGNYKKENPEVINKQGMCNLITKIPCYNQKIEMVQIRLDKGKDLCYTTKENRFYKWVKFMTAKNIEEMQDLVEGDENMELALEYVQEFLEDEEAALLARSRDISLILQGEEQGIEQGRKQGIEQGRKQGIEQGRKSSLIQTAKNMLKMNMSIDDIAQATGLKLKEIKKLKDTME